MKNLQKRFSPKFYVDKTGLIEYTNQVINTVQRYVCVSRPRRFWKIYDGGYADGLLWEGMRFQRTFFWIEKFLKMLYLHST